MGSMTTVDVAVIGRGMIGSAAARHLAEAGIETALIGPDEPAPEERASSVGPYCSHCDEGRITRIAGRTMVWAELAARSISRYRDIAIRSGISFHGITGMAAVTPNLDDWVDSGLIMGSDIRKVDAGWLETKSGIVVTNDHPIGFEGPPAGHINPRRLVAAQTKLADAADATIIRDTVSAMSSTANGFEVAGAWGTVAARRVLLATGAFGRDLLDGELILERRPRTVVMAEVDATVQNLPSLVLYQPPDDRLEAIYWVPPVPYPDGRVCLKIGGNLHDASVADDEDDLTEWFRSDGDVTEIDALRSALQRLLPAVEFRSFHSTPCVVTGTPSEYPYLGFVDDGVAVAVGGNGSAAKSSDELGRLAASLFLDDGWTDSIDQNLFEPQLR